MGLSVDIKKVLGDFRLDVRFRSGASRIGILGASGCGKSLTLKSIAGIETPDEGTILINDTVVFHSGQKVNVPPQKRKIGYLFQNYALFPTMTVERNIAAGLKGTKREKKERVREMVCRFHLEGLEKRLPGELSGGQQQRAALARISEDLLIMDQGMTVAFGETRVLFRNPGKKAAARLTGCKNFSRIQRLDAHRLQALDWGIELEVAETIEEDVTKIGFRAHEFVPIWGERKKNCIRVQVAGSAELPFEKNFYLTPEGEEKEGREDICWFLQRDRWERMKEKGMPDYLQFPKDHILLLKEDC